MQANKTYDLFISYVEADAAWTKGYLLDALDAANINWCSHEAFKLGRPKLLEFEDAVRNSSQVLIVFSPAYVAGDFTSFFDLLIQSYGAETGTWPVIPLILEDVKLPTRITQLVSLEATNSEDREQAVNKLLDDLNKPRQRHVDNPSCPYRGMLPYREQDNRFFHGRDSEIKELLTRLKDTPIQMIIGPSGSGKSSLVFAGVIPALLKTHLFGNVDWEIRKIRTSALTLDDFLLPNQDKQTLLILDQFEEIFSFSDEAKATLLEALQETINEASCKIIFTARADFYSELMLSPIWPSVSLNRFELLSLGEKELTEIITQPAEEQGVYIESALVERLVGDALGEPGVLPFLQETLFLLWDGLERRFLPLKAYEAMVISRASYGNAPVNGMQVAMERKADATYERLDDDEKLIARRILLRLVQFVDGREHVRRQQTYEKLQLSASEKNVFESTIAKLTEGRLLTLSSREDKNSERFVDLSHEALIKGWSRLSSWIETYRDLETQRRAYRVQASNWLALDKKSGYLDQQELVNAMAWLRDSEQGSFDVDPLIIELFGASKGEVTKQRVVKVALPIIGVSVFLVLVWIAWSLYVYHLKEQTREDNPLLDVPAASAMLGSSSPYAQLEEKPQRIVKFDQFQIDSFEVSNKNYQNCVRARWCNEPKQNLESYYTEAFIDHPVVGVTFIQAKKYCEWLGKELPTAEQWERVARGLKGESNWPWGDEEPTPNYVHLATFESDFMESRRVNFAPHSYQKELPLNLIGNVWEWVVVQVIKDKKKSIEAGVMGGSYLSTIQRVSEIRLNGDEVTDIEYGFRCVSR